MNEMNNHSEPFSAVRSHMLLSIAVMVFFLWLWMSWIQGVFPFSSGGTATTSEKIEQQLSEKDVLDSLTSSATSSETLSPSVLKSLTASSKKGNAASVDTAVLDSLTPPR